MSAVKRSSTSNDASCQEQQQDTTSPNGTVHSLDADSYLRTGLLPTAWHATLVFFYFWLFYYAAQLKSVDKIAILKGVNIPTIGGPFKYLTHINLWIKWLFFTLQLVADLSPRCLKRHIQSASSFFFATLVIPTAAQIFIVFWTIYGIDRNLIFPEALDEFIPWYMNQFWHTTIILWVLLEVCIVNHKFPGIGTAGIAMIAFNSSYFVWLLYINAVTGYWVYPFLGHLSPLQLAVFFGSSMLSVFGFHLAGKYLTSFRWYSKKKKL